GFWLSLLAAFAGYELQRPRLRMPPAFGALCAVSIVALAASLLAGGFLSSLALLREWSAQRAVFALQLHRHVVLSASALLAGGLIGAGIGFGAARSRALRSAGFLVLNVIQTLPSLALFGFLIIPLAALAARHPSLRALGISGIGATPALIALSLYAALPVARNCLAALEGIPAAARDAGRGMGMSALQLFLRVELPLALPLAVAGLRVAAVQVIGNTAVAALIGAGGLGVFIFQGLGQYAMDMVLLGALPIIGLALCADALMGVLGWALSPRGGTAVPRQSGVRAPQGNAA
ncbi:MAG TPA: ABC transporter permease, partial [Rectinemataceae bacterium]|nr:ABC transporter permease [Rectinemataceae bacterium]